MYRVACIMWHCYLMYLTGRLSHGVDQNTSLPDIQAPSEDFVVVPPPQERGVITLSNQKAIAASQDTHSRVKRDIKIFQTMTDEANWKAYRTGSTDLSTVLEQINLRGMSSQSIINQYTQSTADSNTMEVTVDEDVTALDIAITGPTNVTEAVLTDPDGVNKTFTDGMSSRRQESDTLIMSIQNPAVGTWILTRTNNSSEWHVNITATSGINIDFRLIQTDDVGFHTILDRNPITGRMYTFGVIVSNINSNFTPLSLVLQDEGGDALATFPLNMSYTLSGNIGHVEVAIPSSKFYVQLSGMDASGSSFIRSSWRQMSPAFIDLIVHPITGRIGSAENITYKLTNYVANTTYDVTMSSTVTSSMTRTHTMTTFEIRDDTFEINSTVGIEYLSYTIAVSENGTSTTLQSISYTLQLASALCTVSTTTNDCDDTANSTTCSVSTWSATAVFNFDVSVFVVTSGVSVTHNATENTRLDLSGDCCSLNVTLSAYSASGDGCQVRLPSDVQEDTQEDEEHRSILYIIIGAVAASIAFGFITAVVCKLTVMKKGNSVQSKDHTANMVDQDPFASLHSQPAIAAPVATSITIKRFPLLEKDYQKAYNVRPKTGVTRHVPSRPQSGHFSLYINSRPGSLR